MKLILCIMLAGCLISCKKNGDSLNGSYTETSPVAGRSQLYFLNDEMLVKSEPGSAFKDTFYFILGPGRISLRHSLNQSSTLDFEFEELDNRSFRIGNLYPRLPGTPPTNMIFRK